MKSITCVEDLKCFDGCIVAFTSTSNISDRLFYRDENPEIKYGVVNHLIYGTTNGNMKGYTIYNFMSVGRNGPNIPIIYTLDNIPTNIPSNMKMRGATINEIEMLRNLVSNRQIYNGMIPIFISQGWEQYKQNAKRFEDV